MGTEESRGTDQAKLSSKRKKAIINNTPLSAFLSPEKAETLQKTYLLDLTKKIDLLVKHLEEKNMIEIRHIAHQLKGSGKTYGFEYITDVGIALSFCAMREDCSGLGDLIHDLDDYVKDRKKALT